MHKKRKTILSKSMTSTKENRKAQLHRLLRELKKRAKDGTPETNPNRDATGNTEDEAGRIDSSSDSEAVK